MIPIRGTVRVLCQGQEKAETFPVLGTDGEDFLIAYDDFDLDRVNARWVSDLIPPSRVERYLPERETIPATPGWWARVIWLEEKADEVHEEWLPIVAWEEPSLEGAGKPIVLEEWNGSVVRVAESEPIFDGNGMLDTIVYDPDRRAKVPEAKADLLRERVRARAEAAARRAEEAAAP